jgi:hypothetical protein
VEWWIQKFIKGASTGEPSLAVFGGVVFQGGAKVGKLGDGAGQWGHTGGTRGRIIFSAPLGLLNRSEVPLWENFFDFF